MNGSSSRLVNPALFCSTQAMPSIYPQSWLIGIAAFLVLELGLKVCAELFSPEFPLISLEPWVSLGATHYRNPNSCLGVLRGFPDIVKFLITASAACMLFAFVAYCHFAPIGPNVKRATAFLIAGASGNLVDRIALGVVVDYVDIQLGPNGSILYLAWNLSDLAINMGVAFLLIANLYKEHPFDDDVVKKSD